VIAVLGGGVMGASVALFLARRGRRDVVVFDPQLPGPSTERAMGGFRTQHGSALNIALALHSREFFVSRTERVRFQPSGYLYLAEDDNVAAELATRAEFQASFGLPIEHPDPEAKVPFLVGDGYRASNFCALDGVYLPPLVHRDGTRRSIGAEFSTLHQARAAYERDYILKKLDDNHGNISRTAEVLGLERSHLYRKMKTLGIAVKE